MNELDALAAAPIPGPSREIRVVRYDGEHARARFDTVATEEPLEIRLRAGDQRRTLAIAMRTPGHDFELVAGFLYAEGVLRTPADLLGLSYCIDRDVDPEQRYNIVNADLAGAVLPATDTLERHVLTTSACGVCGKANLEALELRGVAPLTGDLQLSPATLASLPITLRSAQGVFATTGGLHAAGLFTASGTLIAAREDVGRHNALDKLIGCALMQGRLPLDRGVVCVSGRASYELVQKALVARVPVLCAVSAPSSLAIDVATHFGMTLAGFVRGERFNVYAGAERIVS